MVLDDCLILMKHIQQKRPKKAKSRTNGAAAPAEAVTAGSGSGSGDESSANESDVDFLANNTGYAGFVMALDASRLDVFGKRTKRKPQEQDIENKVRRQPSTAGWEAENAAKAQRLPIKNKQGALVPNQHFIKEDAAAAAAQGSDEGEEDSDAVGEPGGGTGGSESGDSDSEDMSVYDSADDAEDDDVEQQQEPALSGLDLVALRKRRYAQKKADIAQLCEAILEGPEEAVVRQKSKDKGAAAAAAAALAAGEAIVTVLQLSATDRSHLLPLL